MRDKENPMTIALTERQQQASDAAPADVPARVSDPAAGQVSVLLESMDFDRLRDMLDDEPDAPRAADPRTGQQFALVPEARYQRCKALFEEDPPIRFPMLTP